MRRTRWDAFDPRRFQEFYDKVGGTAFDIEKAKAVFLAMVEDEPNLDLLLNTEVTAPILDADTLTGVSVSTDGAEKEYLASVIIDATADADLAAAAGVPYTFAGEGYRRKRSPDGSDFSLYFIRCGLAKGTGLSAK